MRLSIYQWPYSYTICRQSDTKKVVRNRSKLHCGRPLLDYNESTFPCHSSIFIIAIIEFLLGLQLKGRQIKNHIELWNIYFIFSISIERVRVSIPQVKLAERQVSIVSSHYGLISSLHPAHLGARGRECFRSDNITASRLNGLSIHYQLMDRWIDHSINRYRFFQRWDRKMPFKMLLPLGNDSSWSGGPRVGSCKTSCI